MRNLFAGKAFQAYGAAKPISGQGVGGPIPLAGAPQQGAPVKGKAVPVSKPKAAPAMPGKSSFSGDCPICH